MNKQGKNLSLLEERIKEAEKQKEQERQTQRTQQRQRQGQRKQRTRSKQQQVQWAKSPINDPKAVREEPNPMTIKHLEANNRIPQIRPKAETKVIRETNPRRALKRTDNSGR